MKTFQIFFLFLILFFSCNRENANKIDELIADADISDNFDDDVIDEEPFAITTEPVLCKKKDEECGGSSASGCCYGSYCIGTRDKPPKCVEYVMFGKEAMQDAKYSPDGKIIAIISEGFLRLYDSKTKEEILSVNCGNSFYIYNILFSLDSSVIFVFNGVQISAYRVSDGAKYYDSVIETGGLYDYALSFSGRYLAMTGGGNSVDVIDLNTGAVEKTVKTYSFHEYGSVIFTSDDKKIVAGMYKVDGDYGGALSVWDFHTGISEKRIDVCMDSLVYDLVPDKDPDHVIAACYDGTLNKVSIKQGKIIKKTQIHDDGIEEIAISKDFKKIAALCQYRTVKIINSEDLSVEKTFSEEINIRNLSFGNSNEVIGVGKSVFAYTLDGDVIYLFPDGNSPLYTFILDVSKGEVAGAIEKQGPNQNIVSVDLLKDNDTIFTLSTSGEIHFFSLNEQKLKNTHSVTIKNIIIDGDVSDDGKKVAFLPESLATYVYDTEEKKSKGTANGCWGSSYNSRLDLSDDGNFLVSTTLNFSNGLCITDLTENETKRIDKAGAVVKFSPGGTTIGSAGYRIMLWDYNENAEIFSYGEENLSINSMDFSPDGKKIAAVNGFLSILLIDIESNMVESEFSLSDTDPIDFIKFSPDGKTVATLSRYGEILLFDIAGKKNLSAIYPSDYHFESEDTAHVKLDYNNEGTKLIVSRGRKIHIFDISYVFE